MPFDKTFNVGLETPPLGEKDYCVPFRFNGKIEILAQSLVILAAQMGIKRRGAM